MRTPRRAIQTEVRAPFKSDDGVKEIQNRVVRTGEEVASGEKSRVIAGRGDATGSADLKIDCVRSGM